MVDRSISGGRIHVMVIGLSRKLHFGGLLLKKPRNGELRVPSVVENARDHQFYAVDVDLDLVAVPGNPNQLSSGGEPGVFRVPAAQAQAGAVVNSKPPSPGILPQNSNLCVPRPGDGWVGSSGSSVGALRGEADDDRRKEQVWKRLVPLQTTVFEDFDHVCRKGEG